jgi:CRP-like cAMP-binding protein
LRHHAAAAARERLVENLLWEEVDAGTVLVPPDDAACGLVGVVRGQVALRFHPSSRLVELRRPGFWCGRATPVVLTPSTLSVEVHRPATIVRLPAACVPALLEAEPHLLAVFSDLMAAQARLLAESLDILATRNLRTRLARKIIACVGATPGARLDATQEELAQLTSASRNSVNRALLELERQASVHLGYGHVVVRDGETLLRLAERPQAA